MICDGMVAHLNFIATVTLPPSLRSLCKAGAVQSLASSTINFARFVVRGVPIVSCLVVWANEGVTYIISYSVCFIGIYRVNFSEGGCVREFQFITVHTIYVEFHNH